MIIWTEKKIRQIFNEELTKIVGDIHTQEENLDKLLRQVGKDFASLRRDVESLKAKKVVACIEQTIKQKRGQGSPRKNK